MEAERKHVVAITGKEVTLRCRTEGQPAPIMRWFKAHQMISSGPGMLTLLEFIVR